MNLKEVHWGAIVLGAAAVTTIVAFAPIATVAGATMLEAMGGGFGAGASVGANSAILGTAAAVGGIVGNMTSKLFARFRDATTTLLER